LVLFVASDLWFLVLVGGVWGGGGGGGAAPAVGSK
jgi:hypothetical protein